MGDAHLVIYDIIDATSSKSRPNEVDGGGRDVYCCIPLCGSATYDRFMIKTEIGFFKFPDEKKYPVLRKKWISTIKQFRRKGSNDSFQIKSTTKVCEFHFKPEEIKVSMGIGRKSILPGAIPSIFKFRGSASPKKRKLPTKRVASTPIEESSASEYEEEVDYLENDEIENDNIDCCEPCQYKNAEIERLRKRVNELEVENAYLKDEVDTLKPKIFDYKNIL